MRQTGFSLLCGFLDLSIFYSATYYRLDLLKLTMHVSRVVQLCE